MLQASSYLCIISPLAKLLTIHIFVFPESKVNSLINFSAHQRAVCRLFSQQRLDAFTSDNMRVCYASGLSQTNPKGQLRARAILQLMYLQIFLTRVRRDSCSARCDSCSVRGWYLHLSGTVLGFPIGGAYQYRDIFVAGLICRSQVAGHCFTK